ncbi:MAG: initiation control protein YabA [Clostridia bacterium]|nr:DNA replication initiation control protein YabA [Clostridia bacterium]MDH7573360.1 initiation control protein YabA [Clostridia bacterium]
MKSSLTEALAQIEGRLAGLLAEVQELRSRIWGLEEENRNLRAQLYSGYHRPGPEQGVVSLRELYREGYHICPPYFARPLNYGMGCLLCLALLARLGREEGNEQAQT